MATYLSQPRKLDDVRAAHRYVLIEDAGPALPATFGGSAPSGPFGAVMGERDRAGSVPTTTRRRELKAMRGELLAPILGPWLVDVALAAVSRRRRRPQHGVTVFAGG
jgi:hypothetical protein